jgi:peptidyl-tRNA hydrolase, PTH1 family
MWLIVGLGNPGPKYRGNRHNVGFMVLDALAGAAAWKDKFKGDWTRVGLGGQDVVLLKPMTYMNLSGESVQSAMTFFKVPVDHVLVVHDELDLAFRDVRVKLGGGAAGHNGLKSIIQHAGADFTRVRIGIGRPPRGATESWVLGDFSTDEGTELGDVLQVAALATRAVVETGPQAAQNKFNARPAVKAERA